MSGSSLNAFCECGNSLVAAQDFGCQRAGIEISPTATAFHKRFGRVIKLITVQEILDETHVQKL